MQAAQCQVQGQCLAGEAWDSGRVVAQHCKGPHALMGSKWLAASFMLCEF